MKNLLCTTNVLLLVLTQQTLVRGDVCSGICESGSVCQVFNDMPACFCEPGYEFIDNRCQKFDKPPEPQNCNGDDSCPYDRQCIGGQCVNPCANNPCGKAKCTVNRHQRQCLVIRSSRGSTCDVTGESILKKKFEFVDVERTWEQARSYCWERNMILANIESQEDNIEFERYLYLVRDRVAGQNLWLGARDFQEKKNFQWLESGANQTLNSYSNWSVGQGRECPEFYRGNVCLATVKVEYGQYGRYGQYGPDGFMNTKWCNYKCNQQFKFVCHYYDLE